MKIEIITVGVDEYQRQLSACKIYPGSEYADGSLGHIYFFETPGAQGRLIK